MGSEETQLAINIAITIAVAVLVFILLGGSILAFLNDVANSRRQSTTELRTEQICNYKETGTGFATFYQSGDSLPVDKFALSLMECYSGDEQREIRNNGGPVIQTAESCPAGDKEGLNIYLVGPVAHLRSGKSYEVIVKAVGGGAFPDACITVTEVS